MEKKDRFLLEMENRNRLMSESSLENWFPVVKRLKIPAPKTVIVPLSKEEIEGFSEEVISSDVGVRILEAAKGFGFPFFLKTDQASGKHQWKDSCFVTDSKRIDKHVHEIVCFHLMADFFGIPFKSFVVREYIPLEAPFVAFTGEMPIAKERRYFVRAGRVECRHEYWVEGAVAEGVEVLTEIAGFKKVRQVPPSNWRELLTQLNTQTSDEIPILTDYAERVGKELGGYWSVDFAKTRMGWWSLIDMARGEISYHIEGCPLRRAEG